MDSKKNKITLKNYLVLSLVIMVIPNVLVDYFNHQTRNNFYDHLREDTEICYERAAQDNFPRTICSEIKANTKEAFLSAAEMPQFMFLAMTGLIFGLSFGLIGLKKQIDELKEKIDV